MAGYDVLWFIAIVVGTVLLGSVIAYAIIRTRSRTPAELRAGEAGTRRIYKSSDPGRRGDRPTP